MKNDNRMYDDGRVFYWNYCDKGKINLWTFKELSVDLCINYEDHKFWYRITGATGNNGLREILDDDIAQYLTNFIPINPQKEVEIFIVKEVEDSGEEDEIISYQEQDLIELECEVPELHQDRVFDEQPELLI